MPLNSHIYSFHTPISKSVAFCHTIWKCLSYRNKKRKKMFGLKIIFPVYIILAERQYQEGFETMIFFSK